MFEFVKTLQQNVSKGGGSDGSVDAGVGIG